MSVFHFEFLIFAGMLKCFHSFLRCLLRQVMARSHGQMRPGATSAFYKFRCLSARQLLSRKAAPGSARPHLHFADVAPRPRPSAKGASIALKIWNMFKILHYVAGTALFAIFRRGPPQAAFRFAVGSPRPRRVSGAVWRYLCILLGTGIADWCSGLARSSAKNSEQCGIGEKI